MTIGVGGVTPSRHASASPHHLRHTVEGRGPLINAQDATRIAPIVHVDEWIADLTGDAHAREGAHLKEAAGLWPAGRGDNLWWGTLCVTRRLLQPAAIPQHLGDGLAEDAHGEAFLLPLDARGGNLIDTGFPFRAEHFLRDV